MKIRIIETGELKQLIATGINGVEWTYDLLGNNSATTYNNETEEHEMSQDDFNWWEEYILNDEKDAEEITGLVEEFGIDESEIRNKINEYNAFNNDLGDQHSIIQNVIGEFRKERE
ncbi:MAG: hypothetical protein RSA57_03895 [Cetobacterium sp.]|uniref:hypothetical protein n=1 Tax=Bacteria TaxID=2 RepID=UPI002FCAC9C3